MAFDLQVFNQQTNLALTETIAQEVEKFNEASGGAIVLQNQPAEGDFDIKASFKAISGLVRRRNAYGNGAVQSKRLEQLLNVAVKVAAGTPPIDYEPGQYQWILKNPELAAITIGEQLAKARLADMLNTAVLAGVSAVGGVAELVHDDKKNLPTFRTLNKGASKFGDRSNALKAWVMHSTTMHSLYDNALTNAERLFSYDNVNVLRDPFGRVLVVTDSPALIGADATYNTLGLVENGIVVSANDDFNSVIVPKVGGENIGATYQAEWSYNVGVMGFKWDIAQGGSPTDEKLALSANWIKTASSVKDCAGVLVKTK